MTYRSHARLNGATSQGFDTLTHVSKWNSGRRSAHGHYCPCEVKERVTFTHRLKALQDIWSHYLVIEIVVTFKTHRSEARDVEIVDCKVFVARPTWKLNRRGVMQASKQQAILKWESEEIHVLLSYWRFRVNSGKRYNTKFYIVNTIFNFWVWVEGWREITFRPFQVNRVSVYFRQQQLR